MKEYKFKINGRQYDVTVGGIENSVADVNVNGVSYSVEIDNAGPAATTAAAATVPTVKEPSKAPVIARQTEPAANAGTKAASSGKTVTSPLPGVIINVCVTAGQSIKRGQRIAVLEAMKMENDILASTDGTVTKICVSKGDSVLEGAKIAVIE